MGLTRSCTFKRRGGERPQRKNNDAQSTKRVYLGSGQHLDPQRDPQRRKRKGKERKAG